MKALISYVIPFSGLKNGIHHFDFQINEDFFKNFEDSLISVSNINVRLMFDKQPSMFVLDFEFEGTVQFVCDRCVEDFDLPIEGEQQFIVKMRAEAGEEEEIIYIQDTETSLNVAPLVYEVLHLNIPLKKACALDEEDLPSCGFSISDYYSDDDWDITEDDLNDDDDHQDDAWSALKDFKSKS